MMGHCFVCDEELKGDDCLRLSTTRTPYSKIVSPEYIAEFLEKVLWLLLTNDEHAYEKCTTHMNQIDKLEIDLKLVKNAMLSCIRKKHDEILVTDEDVKTVKVEKCDEPLKVLHPLKLSERQNILIKVFYCEL